MNKLIRKYKKDIILFVVIIMTAVSLWGAMAIYDRVVNKQGNMVVITIDGEEYGTYKLNEDRVIEIAQEHLENKKDIKCKGSNTVVIKDNQVYMSYADCPDQYCVKHTPLVDTSETIVCLPHKLVVKISWQEENEPDVDIISE